MSVKMEFVLGNERVLETIVAQRPYGTFAEQTIVFLSELSSVLLGRRTHDAPCALPDGKARIKDFPDVAAFGFWCRRAHVLEMKRQDPGEKKCRIGRGVSLHFVSSNVPTLFGYSMAAALLAGDCVLLRLPSKRSEQEDIIVDALRAVMEKMPFWKERIVLFRSPREKEITDALSALCDVRVIWGGDRAVQEIRRSPLPARALELPFADRRSLAVFSAEAVLRAEDLAALAHAFYNDTYRSDQNACSSPHLLFWVGEEACVRQAQKRFRDALEKETYHLQPVVAVKKWEQALYLAATQSLRVPKEDKTGETAAPGISRCGNLAIFAEPERLSAQIWEETVPGGFFFQGSGRDLTPLFPALSRKVQTLTCFGVNRQELAEQLVKAGVTGVDRIVEVGHAQDFSLVWDGMDLIGQMSRQIET